MPFDFFYWIAWPTWVASPALIASAWETINHSLGFMVWNTFLALIPWVVSLWIFRGRGAGVRRVSWWIGLVVFIAFLPNAPYVLTDIIHLVRGIRRGAEMWTVVLIWIPQYFLFMLIGFEAYVLSLVNLGHYLKKQGQGRWVGAAELTLHGLCAVGIYLGRFPRFNSWDVITGPKRLLIHILKVLPHLEPIAIILVTFTIIAVLYWPLKQISLALALYWRHSRQAALTPEQRRYVDSV
jgi:uncharacterized membrane protein